LQRKDLAHFTRNFLRSFFLASSRTAQQTTVCTDSCQRRPNQTIRSANLHGATRTACKFRSSPWATIWSRRFTRRSKRTRSSTSSTGAPPARPCRIWRPPHGDRRPVTRSSWRCKAFKFARGVAQFAFQPPASNRHVLVAPLCAL